MSTPPPKTRARRVTVALRGHSAEARLMSSAARLAHDSAAELAGVFLEDIDLLNLAELPLAFEICRTTSVRRRVEASELARQLAAQAAAAEQALARVASEAGVAWSFRVARGAVTALLEAAAADADMTLFAATAHAVGVTAEVTATAIRRGELSAAVGVVFDGSEAATRALEVSARVAAAEARPLGIVLIAPAGDNGEGLREQAQRILGEHKARFEVLSAPEPMRLVDTLRAQRHAMLVLPSGQAVLDRDTLRMLEEGLDVPILLVR